MRPWTMVAASLLATGTWSGTAAAQAVSAPPVPVPIAPPSSGPPAVTQPGLGAWVVRDENNFDASFVPYDFHFTDMVDGWGFKPGERVVISPQHVDAEASTVTANDGGFFSVRISFDWRFCGAGGVSAPAPSFVAQGDEGTTAHAAQPIPDCPTISATARPRPVDSGTGGGVGAASGTVSPPVVVGPPAIPVPSVPPSNPPVPAPEPSPSRPVTITFDVRGFGFASGEAVTVQAVDLGGEAPEPTNVTADADGRFQTSMTLTLTCTGARAWPMLVAQGNRGTSISAALACWQWYGCQPPRMCPVPDPISDPIPPVVQPNAPVVPAVSGTTQLAGVTSSLHLQKASPHRGARQTALVRASDAGSVTLTIHYSGGKNLTLHATASPLAGGTEWQASLRWTVPRNAHPGPATVEAVFQPGGQTLRTAFRVR